MSAGITRVHGSALTGASYNVTGVQSTFFSGYQPLFVKVQTVSATFDLTTNNGSSYSNYEFVVRAAEAQGSVIGYGIPSNAASSSTAVIMFDAGSLNQGDGAHGSDTNLVALRTAIAAGANGAIYQATGTMGTLAYTDFAVTAYTGFTGAALA
jgi:hypothetical protein